MNYYKVVKLMSKFRFDEIAINCKEKRTPTDEDMTTYIGLEHLDPKNIVVSRWGSSVPIKGDKLVMHKGDVLLGKRNAYLRRAAVAPHDGLFSAHGMILRPQESVVDKDFFPFFILSDYFFDEAIKISVGSLSPTINWKDLEKIEFKLPPLDRQHELAGLLWAMNNTLEQYRALLLATDKLVKSQYIELFGIPGKDSKGWGLTTLGQCCELNPRRPKNIDDDMLVSFIPMPAVSENGHLDCSDIRPYKEVRKGFTYFAENDVLFAKITPCMENGKGAIALGLSNGIGSGSTEFHVLRPIEGKSNPYWLYILTMFDSFRINARKVMTGTGGQLRVPIAYLEKFPIALPPIELQNEFEIFVKQAEKSKLFLQRAMDDLQAMFNNVLENNLRNI